jgi:AGZA family xanthine/uracil permease-like MFS transporter
MLEKLFHLSQRNTSIKTEIMSGSTTFLTMAYIVFVQPAVLSVCGMDAGSVFVATCIASAFTTILMGLLTNYPIAQAPAMGHNFFFAFAAVPLITLSLKEGSEAVPWQIALGAVCVSGILFLLLSLTPFMKTVVKAIPDTLKHAIAVGIGLLIAFLGLQWGGVVVASEGTLVQLGNIRSAPVLLTLGGTLLIAVLSVRKVRGAILIGILLNAIVGLILGIIKFKGIASLPPTLEPTLFKLNILGALNIGFFTIVFTFFILDLFDTIGTLIGVSQKAGLIEPDGSLPKSKQALQADALGTIGGAILGTSTVTSYIESSAGISQGGRTGLSNMVTGFWFVAVLFFSPLVSMIGSPLEYTMLLNDGHSLSLQLYPIIAPALIIVGCLMMSSVVKIEWTEFSEALPAFLTIIMMPLSGFSITEGIAFGFISYTIVKIFSGKMREVHWLIILFAILFIVRYMVI